MLDVIVIGGGAAGLTAAIRSASLGAHTLLLERGPRAGRKLLLTGGGRCNLALDRDAAAFVRDCGPQARFLHNAIGRFDCAATRAWFGELGLATIREPDGRCFPASGRALDVLRVLESGLARTRVQVAYEVRVTRISRVGASFQVQAGTTSHEARSVILATGGLSYPDTGSSGDGYGIAAALSHRVVGQVPGEVPLVAGPAWIRELSGLGLEDVVARFVQGKRSVEVRGALLFTHFGVSGPAVLDGSRLVARWFGGGPVALMLDLVPDISLEELDRDLELSAASGERRSVRTMLRHHLPERLANGIVANVLSGGDARVAGLPARSRRELAMSLKGLALTVTGTRGFAEAVVTIGGVDTSQVHPVTLESRLVPGLHFAGELLDVDGPRGGYNLQIAWSTGFAAGTHAAGK
jgi:predicted Rossmann fold flavoprotein